MRHIPALLQQPKLARSITPVEKQTLKRKICLMRVDWCFRFWFVTFCTKGKISSASSFIELYVLSSLNVCFTLQSCDAQGMQFRCIAQPCFAEQGV